jgi:hypothetical protein
MSSQEGKKKDSGGRAPQAPRLECSEAPARRLAAVILEVLGGERTPGEAAQVLSTSVARYYALESRALDGLIKACQTPARGGAGSADKQIELLRRQIERLKLECARKQALLRAAQRAVGLTAAAADEGKRKRRPAVRALKAAAVLRSQTSTPASSVSQQQAAVGTDANGK